jgi:hypothetical protein
MTHRTTLNVVTVIAALLATFHLSDDIVRGFERGGPEMYTGMLIVVVWLYAGLVLSDRRWGLLVLLFMSIGGLGVPYLHMRNGLAGGRIANTSGMFFWVWTLLALGVTSMFSIALAARELWSYSSRNATTGSTSVARRAGT